MVSDMKPHTPRLALDPPRYLTMLLMAQLGRNNLWKAISVAASYDGLSFEFWMTTSSIFKAGRLSSRPIKSVLASTRVELPL